MLSPFLRQYMITFKQFIGEEEREVYAKKLGDVPEWTPSLSEDAYRVGDVTFSAKDGLGSVPFNQSVFYHGFVVTMKPSTFFKLALEDMEPERAWPIVKLVWEGYSVGPPFLQLSLVGSEVGKAMLIKGHEGRARMKAFQEIEGDVPVPVHIFLTGGDRNRDVTPENLTAIRHGVYAEGGRAFVEHPFASVHLGR